MKISTEIASIAQIVGMEEAVALCAKAGFDAWDFSLLDIHKTDWQTGLPLLDLSLRNNRHYLQVARELKQIGLDNGIVCNQSHAPFPVGLSPVWDSLELAIECTAEAGGEICVIHPHNRESAEKNAEMYQELLPFAKACGVKIATENMWLWDSEKDESTFAACATSEDFKRHMDIVNDEFFVACLDLGHAEMQGSGDGAVNMIHALGHHLQALHIHDNDRWHDSHQIPLSMDIDFDPILRALKEIGYQGYFTLEAKNFLQSYTQENILEGVTKLKDSAKRLARRFCAL